MDFAGRKPELEFPCTWGYTVIGADEAGMRGAIADVVGARRHTVERSHTSAQGRYRSLVVEVRVGDDEERVRLFEELKARPEVLYLL